MPMLEVKNREYQSRIETAMFDAILRTSMTEDGKTAALLSGEIVQACLNTIAMLAGTSEVTATPHDARLFAEECARTIRTRAQSVREKRAAGEMSFFNVVHASDRH